MILSVLWLCWSVAALVIEAAGLLVYYVGLPLALVYFLLASFCSLTLGRCTSKRRMDGKTVIITGANSGRHVTVKASNFASNGHSGSIRARSVASLDEF
jgi:membrane protein implicated in regulation of membrane protease activity